MTDEPQSDTPPPRSGRPERSYAIEPLRAVTIGALLTLSAGLLLDAAPALSGDQRVIIAAAAAILAALLGLSAGVYRGSR